MLENLIYNQLKFRGYNIKIGAIEQLEIDFVCEKEGRRIYLQSALTINQESTMKREFGNLQKIKNNYPKMVITMDAFSGNNFEGIEHFSIRDFLQKDI